jgi:hypothetical protein
MLVATLALVAATAFAAPHPVRRGGMNMVFLGNCSTSDSPKILCGSKCQDLPAVIYQNSGDAHYQLECPDVGTGIQGDDWYDYYLSKDQLCKTGSYECVTAWAASSVLR